MKKAYGDLGYIQYTAEVEPKYHRKDGASEGIVDLAVTVDEGELFTIASIQFAGIENLPKDALLREMTVRSGDVFNQEQLEASLTRLSQSGQFEMIDPEKDVDYRVDKEAPRINFTIHLKKRVAGSTLTPQPRPIGRVVAIQPH